MSKAAIQFGDFALSPHFILECLARSGYYSKQLQEKKYDGPHYLENITKTVRYLNQFWKTHLSLLKDYSPDQFLRLLDELIQLYSDRAITTVLSDQFLVFINEISIFIKDYIPVESNLTLNSSSLFPMIELINMFQVNHEDSKQICITGFNIVTLNNFLELLYRRKLLSNEELSKSIEILGMLAQKKLLLGKIDKIFWLSQKIFIPNIRFVSIVITTFSGIARTHNIERALKIETVNNLLKTAQEAPADFKSTSKIVLELINLIKKSVLVKITDLNLIALAAILKKLNKTSPNIQQLAELIEKLAELIEFLNFSSDFPKVISNDIIITLLKLIQNFSKKNSSITISIALNTGKMLRSMGFSRESKEVGEISPILKSFFDEIIDVSNYKILKAQDIANLFYSASLLKIKIPSSYIGSLLAHFHSQMKQTDSDSLEIYCHKIAEYFFFSRLEIPKSIRSGINIKKAKPNIWQIRIYDLLTSKLSKAFLVEMERVRGIRPRDVIIEHKKECYNVEVDDPSIHTRYNQLRVKDRDYDRELIKQEEVIYIDRFTIFDLFHQFDKMMDTLLVTINVKFSTKSIPAPLSPITITVDDKAVPAITTSAPELKISGLDTGKIEIKKNKKSDIRPKKPSLANLQKKLNSRPLVRVSEIKTLAKALPVHNLQDRAQATNLLMQGLDYDHEMSKTHSDSNDSILNCLLPLVDNECITVTDEKGHSVLKRVIVENNLPAFKAVIGQISPPVSKSRRKKTTSQKIPLPVIWQTEWILACSLNRKEIMELFTNTFDIAPLSTNEAKTESKEKQPSDFKENIKLPKLLSGLESNINEIQLRAYSGHGPSQYILAHSILTKTMSNLNEMAWGLYWLECAAEQNIPEAQNLMAFLYANGLCVSQDFKKSLRYLLLAANQNDRFALCSIGHCYQFGIILKKDLQKAEECYLKSAQQGLVEAFYRLGTLYEDSKDYAKSEHYYRLAADLGHVDSQALLGAHYFSGKVFRQDYKESVKYLHLAVANKHLACYAKLGACYSHGYGVEKIDYEQAFKYLQEGAEKKDGHCQLGLAMLYEDGKGVPENKEEALRYYLMSADNGVLEAQYRSGLLSFLEGNYDQSYKYLKLASENNHVLAIKHANKIGEFFLGSLTFKNFSKAVQFLQLAADKNFPEALRNLGICYLKGIGVNKNVKEAMKLLRNAAEKKDESALAIVNNIDSELKKADPADIKAICAIKGIEPEEIYFSWQNYLSDKTEGSIDSKTIPDEIKPSKNNITPYQFLSENEQTTDVPAVVVTPYLQGLNFYKLQDYKQAVKYFGIAAEAGDSDALYRLSICYDRELGVEKNVHEKFRLLQLAANQGHTAANYYLGLCYQKKEGTEINIQKAVECFKKAAQWKFHAAQLHLGLAYLHGTIVKQNYQEAFTLLQSAKQSKPDDATTLYTLGYCYENGLGTEKDLATAITFFNKSAELGYEKAKIKQQKYGKNNKEKPSYVQKMKACGSPLCMPKDDSPKKTLPSSMSSFSKEIYPS